VGSLRPASRRLLEVALWGVGVALWGVGVALWGAGVALWGAGGVEVAVCGVGGLLDGSASLDGSVGCCGFVVAFTLVFTLAFTLVFTLVLGGTRGILMEGLPGGGPLGPLVGPLLLDASPMDPRSLFDSTRVVVAGSHPPSSAYLLHPVRHFCLLLPAEEYRFAHSALHSSMSHAA
jgi:hypothetical protein